MSDEHMTLPADVEVEEDGPAYSQGNASCDDEREPLSFMGFEMNLPPDELLETINAWHDLIQRMEANSGREAHAAALATQTRLRCGVAFSVLQHWEAAVRELEQVRDTPGAHPSMVHSATCMLSAVYAAQGQYEEAIACWSTILAEFEATTGTKKGSLSDKVTQLYLFRAQVFAEQGRYAEAAADCDRAERFYPACAEVFSVRGLCRANLGDMGRALADCTRSIELEPNTARCYRRRGTVQRMCREFRAALADFDRALELDPTDERARTGRAEALLGYVLLGQMSAPLASVLGLGGETSEGTLPEAVEAAQ